MTPLERLEDAIDKKPRDGKRHKRSAGMKVIRKAFAEYKKSLDKFCLQCGKKETLSADDLCFSCAKQNREDQTSLKLLQEAGHTRHCACRIVWGDGECECGKRSERTP